MSSENYMLKTLGSLAKQTFVVEKYQRGYKWGIQEVEDLLYDITTFDKSVQAFYCLQPIVVKKIESAFELIDGQQRLTTSFIISQCLGVDLFNLTYKTRPKSSPFLAQIKFLAPVDTKGNNRDILNKAWLNYIEQEPENDNVDNYHFFTAFQVVNQYINSMSPEEIAVFNENFCDYTQVIWYEIISSQTPEEIFINFNQGKIHLEQAELIKALFVLQLKSEQNSEVQVYRTQQFAEEWNTIENHLQDDKFWYFVSNDTSDKKNSNRIDLLFDLVCEKPRKEENALYSYLVYLDKLKDRTLGKSDWQKVKDLYSLLFEWYHDRDIYHLLGLVIHLKTRSLSEVYKTYNKLSNKDAFEQKLKHWLREKIKYEDPNSPYNLSNLSYHSYEETVTMLTIFNVATYHTSDINYFFPFDKLKSQKWSLEHIHAQKAEDFQLVKETKEWLEDIHNLLRVSLKHDQWDEAYNKIKAIEEIIMPLAAENTIPKNVRVLSKELNTLLDKKLNIHSIRNLCLLDGRSNSAIGNANFKEKRTKILMIDREGEIKIPSKGRVRTFIPICTKNVFLKYYTKDSIGIQFTYWGNTDQTDYEDALDQAITTYLN